MNDLAIVDSIEIQDKIFTIRDVQVILDRDLASLYQVETNELVTNCDQFNSLKH